MKKAKWLRKRCLVLIALFSVAIMSQLLSCTFKIDEESFGKAIMESALVTGKITMDSEQVAMTMQGRGSGVIIDVNRPAGDQNNLLSIMQIGSHTIRCERGDDGTEVRFAERYLIALTQEDEDILTALYEVLPEEKSEEAPEFMREFIEKLQKVFSLAAMAGNIDYYISQAFTSPNVEFKQEVILFVGEILKEPKVEFSAVVPAVGGFVGHIELKNPLRERLIREMKALSKDSMLGEEAQRVLERIEG